MNLKPLFATMCMTMYGAAQIVAVTNYPVGLQNPPETSKVTQTFNEATGTYTIHVEENSFGDDSERPAIRFAEFTEILPSEYTTLAFEYKSTHGCNDQKLKGYKLWKGSREATWTYSSSIVSASDWRTYRIDISKCRVNTVNNLGNAIGQYFDIIFMDLIAGADIQLRNLRFEEAEVPFTDVTVSAGNHTIIEAENFNTSVIANRTFSTRQKQLDMSPYIDPTPGQIPIYAFTSVDYEQQDGMAATAALMNKKYRDMEAAGFNITEGGAWPAIDRCFLYDGLTEFNGYQANLHDGCENLKMIIRHAEDADVVRGAMNSPRLAGYHTGDEPHVTQWADGYSIPQVANIAKRIRAIDNSKLLYGNLLHINTIPGDIGASSYDDYVQKYIEQTGMGVLSYDYYAVRIYGPDIDNLNPASPDNCILMPNFFMNMEVISKMAKYYNMKWWGFALAQGGARRRNPSSVYMKGDFRYPEPFEDGMRVQIFSLLAYGAQGLQYWPYAAHGEVPNGPVNKDGSLNPVYYYIKNINTEVKALTWVFLGAEMIHVGHTNAVTPDGCMRLTKNIMPAGVSEVVTSGQGMPVSTLQNGTNLFMMAVNPDLWNAQDITVTLDKAAKQVLPDGTTVDVAAGTHKTNLAPGRYLIYLLDENAPELDHHVSPAPVYDNYRSDVTDVPFTANSAASNGFYLPDMGTNSWTNYSLITPIEESRTITRDQAIENWGAWYAYTFDVAEDMTVDISIGHSVPWSEYGRVASVGAKPGVSYTIEGEPELNWPKQYAASMTLSIDGETIIPAHSIRPSVPEVFDENGAEFNAILADKSRWIPTDGDENLYFWPKAGGDNDVTPVYNAAPDYRGVALTAGTHRIVVRSNCYPWNFDAIKIAPADMSGIDNVTGDTAATLKATGVNGGILVETDAAFAIYNLSGVQVAEGHGSRLVDLAAGLYIVVADKTSVKVLVK